MAQTSIRVGVLGLKEFAEAMGQVGRTSFDRSQREAVTRLAKGYRAFKRARIASDIDRPAPFTKRGYDWDKAPRTGEIFSRAFIRPKQAQYLTLMEEGGTRRVVGRDGPVIPKPGVTDRYGGFGPRGFKRRFLDRGAQPSSFTASGRPRYRTGDRRYAVLRITTRGGERLFGVFEKRKMGKATTRKRLAAGKPSWRTRLIVRFQDQARYQPKLHFGRDARTYARQRFPMMSLRLFNAELRRALGY